MNDRHNKISICTVIAIDILDQSTKPVFRQIQDKDLFNSIINAGLHEVAAEDRVLVDTGNGTAIALFGAPESAIYLAMMIRDSIDKYNNAGNEKLLVRTAISIGPVRVMNEINGISTIQGDGLDVAERLKRLAAPSQILVSRAFYDITSGLTEEIAAMFSRVGGEHEVYSLRPSHEQPFVPESAAERMSPSPLISRLMENENSPRYGLWGSAALVLLVIIAGGFMLNPQMLQPDLGVVVTDIKPEAPAAELHTVAVPAAPTQIAIPSVAETTTIPAEPANLEPVGEIGSDEPVPSQPRRKKAPSRQTVPTTAEVDTQVDASANDALAEVEETVEEEPVVVSRDETRKVVKARETDTGPAVEERLLPVNSDPPRDIWNAFRESFKQGSTQHVCTQAEIALNQCE